MGHFGIIGQCGKKGFNGVDETCFSLWLGIETQLASFHEDLDTPPLADTTEALSEGSDYRH